MSAAVPPPPTVPKNGTGAAGLVLGLLALLFSFIPLISVIAWPLGILGIVFGSIGIVRVRNGQANNQDMAITGTALAGIGLVICIAQVDIIGTEDQQNPAPGAAPPDAPHAQIELGFGQAHTWSGVTTVQVSAPRKSNPYELPSGARAVEVDLNITNGAAYAINPGIWKTTATHDGIAAKPVYTTDSYGNVQVPPGGTLTLTRAFQITSDSGELRIGVTPSFYATDTAYFHGQL